MAPVVSKGRDSATALLQNTVGSNALALQLTNGRATEILLAKVLKDEKFDVATILALL